MEIKVCHVIKFWTSFQQNWIVGGYYKRDIAFKRGHNVPPWPQEQRKSLAWIGFSGYPPFIHAAWKLSCKVEHNINFGCIIPNPQMSEISPVFAVLMCQEGKRFFYVGSKWSKTDCMRNQTVCECKRNLAIQCESIDQCPPVLSCPLGSVFVSGGKCDCPTCKCKSVFWKGKHLFDVPGLKEDDRLKGNLPFLLLVRSYNLCFTPLEVDIFLKLEHRLSNTLEKLVTYSKLVACGYMWQHALFGVTQSPITPVIIACSFIRCLSRKVFPQICKFYLELEIFINLSPSKVDWKHMQDRTFVIKSKLLNMKKNHS